MLELVNISKLSEKEKKGIDEFILSASTNGEFIHTLTYLAYHPHDRFVDDSVVVRDSGSHMIRGVMMATVDRKNPKRIVSHSGTTFAGPILERSLGIRMLTETMDMILGYYETNYHEVVVKTVPQMYHGQPFGCVDYYLLTHGYVYGMSAMANVIDISGIQCREDILAMFSSKRRNQVKKVISEGMFRFRELPDIPADVWKSMNDNLQQKFDSHTTHSYDEILDLKHRCPKNIRSYSVDTADGIYGAFGLIYLFKNVFHTQYLDLNYDYSTHYPNLLLITELIWEARRLGYRWFSFGASTESGGQVMNEGLYEYKAAYGGGDILLPVFTKCL